MSDEYITAEEQERYSQEKFGFGERIQVIKTLRRREELEASVKELERKVSHLESMQDITNLQMANLKQPMRFEAAKAAMQGLNAGDPTCPPHAVAEQSVECADALLHELAKDKTT